MLAAPVDHHRLLFLLVRLLRVRLQDRSERATLTHTRVVRSDLTTETIALTPATIGMTTGDLEATTTMTPILTTTETTDLVIETTTTTEDVEVTRATTIVAAEAVTRATGVATRVEIRIVEDEVVTVATTREVDIVEEITEVDIKVPPLVDEEDTHRVELLEEVLLKEVVEDDRHPACLFLPKEAEGPR